MLFRFISVWFSSVIVSTALLNFSKSLFNGYVHLWRYCLLEALNVRFGGLTSAQICLAKNFYVDEFWKLAQNWKGQRKRSQCVFSNWSAWKVIIAAVMAILWRLSTWLKGPIIVYADRKLPVAIAIRSLIHFPKILFAELNRLCPS